MKRVSNLIRNLLFPPHCVCCGELIDVKLTERVTTPLCPDCRAELEREKNRECAVCGLSMKFCRCIPKNMERAQCTALLKLISYRTNDNNMSIKNFVYSVKHSNYRVSFDFIAEQMRDMLIPEMRASGLLPSDCIITFLPRSMKNRANDGFDQSFELARALSRATGIELASCFGRKMITNEQKKLNRYERQLNMNSAYVPLDVGRKIKDKTVILVDDIVTTGSSMASCARLAYSMGAYAVMGITLGYTEKSKNNYKK